MQCRSLVLPQAVVVIMIMQMATTLAHACEVADCKPHAGQWLCASCAWCMAHAGRGPGRCHHLYISMVGVRTCMPGLAWLLMPSRPAFRASAVVGHHQLYRDVCGPSLSPLLPAAGAAAIKYGSLLIDVPFEAPPGVALALVLGTPLAYAAMLLLRQVSR